MTVMIFFALLLNYYQSLSLDNSRFIHIRKIIKRFKNILTYKIF